MRKIIRILMHWFYRPLLQLYLRKGRRFHFDGFRLFIPAGVFHPGFFGSSKVMAQFLQGQQLEGKSLLEIGCGSGLLALAAARQGARVAAVDINPTAVACCRDNAASNGLSIHALQSDLFNELSPYPYDIIISNPPYFEGTAKNATAAAWYCGESYSFFQRFFAALPKYSHPESRAWLILSESCDLAAIRRAAEENRCSLHPLLQVSRLFEFFILFEVKSTMAPHGSGLAK